MFKSSNIGPAPLAGICLPLLYLPSFSQVLVSMGFCRKEYWSELPCPPSGVLPDPGIELLSFIALAGT